MKKTFTLLTAGVIAFSSCGSGEDSKEDKTTSTKKENTVSNENQEITQESDSGDFQMVELPSGWEFVQEEQPMYYVYSTDSMLQEEMDQMAEKLAVGFGNCLAEIESKELQMAGAPMSVWTRWEETGYAIFDCGIPVVFDAVKMEGAMVKEIAPGTKCKYLHVGDYSTAYEPHQAVNEWAAQNGILIDNAREIYLTDPGLEPDTSKWETEIWYDVTF